MRRTFLALARDRLELDLCRRNSFGLVYGLSGRASIIAGVARRALGSYARTAVDAPPVLSLPAVLDLTDSCVLDRYGGPGWGRSGPHGATTRGGESRLVLPLQAPRTNPLVLTVEAMARDRPAEIDVLVNERRWARIRVDRTAVTYHVKVCASTWSARHPVEIAFRGVRPFLGPRLPRLLIRRVELDRAPRSDLHGA